MADSGSGGGGDAGVQTLGQMMLDLAAEWLAVKNPNTEAMGLMRDVYGALALQLAVRAKEMQPGTSAVAARAFLEPILNEFRSEFADTVATIKH